MICLERPIWICGEHQMLKKYKLSFEIWGSLLFLIVMIPSSIWFAIPAPNDILRARSVTETIDTVASVCQILMIAALCIFRNKEYRRMCAIPFIFLVVGCCFLYFLSWIVYYGGVVNAIVILGLTISPCLAFLFFAIDRKNGIALIPISIFSICHLIYGVVNFVI